ncbi:MAG: hypothetical protein IJ613_02120 [Muribaculaceae bacterium]|nr:hypothetical protein [Muribaculaceae bacterium]MBR1474352.1 hypothetical protein [Muribaculaceae bacterium]
MNYELKKSSLVAVSAKSSIFAVCLDNLGCATPNSSELGLGWACTRFGNR